MLHCGIFRADHHVNASICEMLVAKDLQAQAFRANGNQIHTYTAVISMMYVAILSVQLIHLNHIDSLHFRRVYTKGTCPDGNER